MGPLRHRHRNRRAGSQTRQSSPMNWTPPDTMPPPSFGSNSSATVICNCAKPCATPAVKRSISNRMKPICGTYWIPTSKRTNRARFRHSTMWVCWIWSSKPASRTPSAVGDPRSAYATSDDSALNLTLRIDQAIRSTRPDDWRGVPSRERIVKGALYGVLRDASEVERLFPIVKAQADY